jgi:hypothetical protein
MQQFVLQALQKMGYFVGYPICYRSLPKSEKFAKYQWISCDAVRDLRDPRQESYKLLGKIKPLDIITTKQEWTKRRNSVLSNVQLDLQKIIEMAYDSNKWRSLFTFKPTKIIKFNVIDCSFNEKIERTMMIAYLCKMHAILSISYLLYKLMT